MTRTARDRGRGAGRAARDEDGLPAKAQQAGLDPVPGRHRRAVASCSGGHYGQCVAWGSASQGAPQSPRHRRRTARECQTVEMDGRARRDKARRSVRAWAAGVGEARRGSPRREERREARGERRETRDKSRGEERRGGMGRDALHAVLVNDSRIVVPRAMAGKAWAQAVRVH